MQQERVAIDDLFAMVNEACSIRTLLKKLA